MGSNPKLIGVILLAVGALIFFGCAAVSVASTMGAEGGSMGGVILGIVVSLFVALPFEAAGVYMLVRSRSQAAQQTDAVRQRKILDMVKTRGQIDISDLVIELNSTTQQVRDDVYKLVGMGLFTGYVNWDKGLLYSKEASQLRGNNTCPNCGGQLSLGGKGVITCPYCGAEIFL